MTKALNILEFGKNHMKWSIYLFMIILLMSVVSAGEHINIMFPEDMVTYGPWSDTYFHYPRTDSEAHHMRVQVDVGVEVAYYNILRNNEVITYVGDQEQEDFNPGDNIVDFEPTDLEPLDLVGYLSTMNEFEVVAYDADGEEIDRDIVTFYLAVNIEDYFDILDIEPDFESTFSITDEDLGKVEITREVFEEKSDLFIITKRVSYVKVMNKFTEELENHTRIDITLTPKIIGQDVKLYSLIPKNVVEHVNNLVLEGQFEVEDPDPLLMWGFANVQDPKKLRYHVNKELSLEEAEEIKLIAIAEGELQEKSILYYLIPILAIPIFIGLFVYFNRFQKEVKK